MRIYKYLHSCLLVENGADKFLIDPGAYSFLEDGHSAETFHQLTAIFITHNHSDHIDPGNLKKILEKNPVPVYGNVATKTALIGEGIEVTLFENGERIIGSTAVQAIAATHGPTTAPPPANTAFVINKKLLITGDSLDDVLLTHKNIQALALPTTAPWMRRIDSVEFAHKITPQHIIPVHDGYLKNYFRDSQDKLLERLLAPRSIAYHPLAQHGEYIDL